MCIGIVISVFVGAAIGVWCKNQMAATSVTVPVMMVFSFLPMIAEFNAAVVLGLFAVAYRKKGLN